MAQRKKGRLDGDTLVRLRLNKGWSQDVLAAKAGVDVRTVRNAENGRYVFPKTLGYLAIALGVEPEELLLSDTAPSRPPEQKMRHGLVQHRICFDALIRDRAPQDFEGRRFVFDSLDAFVDDPGIPSGYFLIHGDPGIGKSAIIARLIQERSLSVYHFNVSLQSINTTRQFIANICARAIEQFGLAYNELPEDFDQTGAFLNKILNESAERSDGEKMIIAVDALDEVQRTGPSARQNPLLLPDAVPEGVYFVVTTRNREDVTLRATHVRTFELEPGGKQNMADVREYVSSWAAEHDIEEWLKRNKTDKSGFANSIAKKSEGNFMYLRHVLPAIEGGKFQRGGVDELPHGLREYYRHHWQQMQSVDSAAFARVYEPVVCVLGAVQEAVPVEQIVLWTNLRPAEVRKALKDWREFLHVEHATEGDRRYRLYHTAFQEFLQDEVDPGLETYHGMIAASALRRIGKGKRRS